MCPNRRNITFAHLFNLEDETLRDIGLEDDGKTISDLCLLTSFR